MLTNFILLFLFSGVPYYLYLEKNKKLPYEKIFFLSAFFVALGMILITVYQLEVSIVIVLAVFIASLFSLYKATKTTNLYKLTYYILFFNAPILFMFQNKEGIYYGVSLLFTLLGLYLMGRYYERHYGSANYQSITGITLVTPFAGFFLTIYLTSLALYPPFPNAILFFNAILTGEPNVLWYLIVITVFLGNFFIAMRVMAKTVFGKPNDNVHYIDLCAREKLVHYAMFLLLIILSILGFQELL
jgi:hypothetical protein